MALEEGFPAQLCIYVITLHPDKTQYVRNWGVEYGYYLPYSIPVIDDKLYILMISLYLFIPISDKHLNMEELDNVDFDSDEGNI